MAEQNNPIRLSSFADLLAVKGAIKTAPVLAFGTGPVTKVDVGSEVRLPHITAEDSIDSIVMRFVRENPNRSEAEIISALNPVLQMPDKIAAALNQLYRAGNLTTVPVLANGTTVTVYRARSKLIQDQVRPLVAPTVDVKPFKLPEAYVLDPNGRIIFEQGMDIAIWKIMQDREWRSIDDIGALLHTYGFHVYAVRTRVKTLNDIGLSGTRWFDTTRKNKARRNNPVPYYRLRIGVEIPKLGVLSLGLDKSEEEEKSGDDAAAAILSGNSVFSVRTQAPAVEAVAETTKEVTVTADTTVRKGDHFPVVLWKLMTGKKDLRAKAMGDLVEPYGFTAGQCASMISHWFKLGYVDKVEVREAEDNKAVGAYTLKDIPMPHFPVSFNSKFVTGPLPILVNKPLHAAIQTLADPRKPSTISVRELAAQSAARVLNDVPAAPGIQVGDSISVCVLKLLMLSPTPMRVPDLISTLELQGCGFMPRQLYSCIKYLTDKGLVERVAVDGGEVNPNSSPLRYTGAPIPEFKISSLTPVAQATHMPEEVLQAPAEQLAAVDTTASMHADAVRTKGLQVPQPTDGALSAITEVLTGHVPSNELPSIAQQTLDLVTAATQAGAVQWQQAFKPADPAEAVKTVAPLVRHLVMIKGVEFTLAEVDEIVAEMNTLKLFTWVSQPDRVVKAKFEIKGLELTPEELNEVLLSMK